jgi:predicted PurR-regulated permease PerM
MSEDAFIKIEERHKKPIAPALSARTLEAGEKSGVAGWAVGVQSPEFVATYPTPLQKRILWMAVTALSTLALVSVIVLSVFVVVRSMGFLQPVLLPLAIAGVLAYLLEPFVAFFCRHKCSRTVGTLIVFLIFFLAVAGVLLSVVPTAYKQGAVLVNNFPAYSKRVQNLALSTLESLERLQNPLVPEALSPPPETLPLPTPSPVPMDEAERTPPDASSLAFTDEGEEHPTEEVPPWGREHLTKYVGMVVKDSMNWLQERVPDLLLAVGNLLQRSLGGFLGAFGLIIGLILVPVFLFYLLRDAPSIREKWPEFVPLPDSALKDEVVSLVREINGYIIAFFRGQVLVAFIDGVLIAIALLFMGMEFAILIGLMVATIGIIPYAGTILTWGPAVLIAAAQYGDWFHPLLVTLIFLGVNQIDSLFITPYILGESVGLHSLTVMVAVLAWTVIIGGLLGALLAVPLTAALKVVAVRYIWRRQPGLTAGTAPPG